MSTNSSPALRNTDMLVFAKLAMQIVTGVLTPNISPSHGGRALSSIILLAATWILIK